jgi:hypothetical protein
VKERWLTPRRIAPWLLAAATLVGPALLVTGTASAAPTPLVGTFTVTAGSCSGGTASGTYLRMVLSGGSNASGPYFSNSDSSCSDNSYTPLAPGSSGGLVTGSYQAQPSPAFDGSGNALAHEITAPVAFEGVKFATATNPTDPQTQLAAPAPSIVANGTALSGNLESFGVSWNNQEFNQGSPKPGGGAPGNTTPVVGTYNPATGAYTLQWSSQVVGGPFNGFSAFWNLTGRFIPAATSSGAPSTGQTGSGASSAGPSAAAPGADSHVGSSAAASGGANSASTTSAPSATTTTTTTAAGNGSTSGQPNHRAVALSSRTVTTGQGGWHSPIWLVVLVALLAVLGLTGVLWSERSLRRQHQ